MTELSFAELLELLADDRDLLERLHDEGLLRSPIMRAYSREEAEKLRVARVLVRELDVNLPGVEVILHMRQQILALRQRMMDILQQAAEARRPL
jgi:MerR family transcriptional regulator/heat shock protein HspR